jgi:hypothetical protein
MRLVIPCGSPSPCQTVSRLGSLGVAASDALFTEAAEVAAFVRGGFGVGVVTRAMRWADEEGLTRLPAHHLLGSRAIAGMWHRRRRFGSEAVTHFSRAVPRIRSALAAHLSLNIAMQAL